MYKGSKNNTSYFLMLTHLSETNGGIMIVEVEPSLQYPITFCCSVTEGSRGAV